MRPASWSSCRTVFGKPAWKTRSPWRWPSSRRPSRKPYSPRGPGPAVTPGQEVASAVILCDAVWVAAMVVLPSRNLSRGEADSRARQRSGVERAAQTSMTSSESAVVIVAIAVRTGEQTRQLRMVCLDALVPIGDLRAPGWTAAGELGMRCASRRALYVDFGRPGVDPVVPRTIFLVAALRGLGSMRETLRVAEGSFLDPALSRLRPAARRCPTTPPCPTPSACATSTAVIARSSARCCAAAPGRPCSRRSACGRCRPTSGRPRRAAPEPARRAASWPRAREARWGNPWSRRRPSAPRASSPARCEPTSRRRAGRALPAARRPRRGPGHSPGQASAWCTAPRSPPTPGAGDRGGRGRTSHRRSPRCPI